MAEETKIEEKEDGSATITVKEEPEEDIQVVEIAAEDGKEESLSPEREVIREQRREERRLKKEYKHKREASERHLMKALKDRNDHLEKRLLALEDQSTGFRIAQVDRSVEDQLMRVEFAKRQMVDARNKSDPEAEMRAIDSLTDEKAKLKELQNYRQQTVNTAKRPSNTPNIEDETRDRLAKSWHSRNSWFDPTFSDTDSRIARVIDQELTEEGWNPTLDEYWEELDLRLEERIPHRYGKQRRAVVGSSRSDNSVANSAQNQVFLTKERVDALKEAGVWDDPVKRKRFTNSYIKYDKEQRNKR